MASTRTNKEWLDDLRSGEASQEAALVDLRELLLRATLYFFGRNLGDFGGTDRDEVVQRAEDSAQDALMAVLAHLSDFRGDSKFTTWAYKFAVNMALTSARRERWKTVSLDALTSEAEDPFGQTVEVPSHETAPEQSAMQDEVRTTIREVIERELTPRQRQILTMMVFHEVPMDEVARHFGMNRNAVYKMLHDARRKLKSGLQARGLEVSETLSIFGAPG